MYGLEAIMPIEFWVLSQHVQVCEHLAEKATEQVWLEQLLEHGEVQINSMANLEQEQTWRKAFVDRHRKGNEKDFEINKPVLVFQTHMGLMPGKLRFSWTGPY